MVDYSHDLLVLRLRPPSLERRDDRCVAALSALPRCPPVQPRVLLRLPCALVAQSMPCGACSEGPAVRRGDALFGADDMDGGGEYFGAVGVGPSRFVPVDGLGGSLGWLLSTCVVRACRRVWGNGQYSPQTFMCAYRRVGVCSVPFWASLVSGAAPGDSSVSPSAAPKMTPPGPLSVPVAQNRIVSVALRRATSRANVKVAHPPPCIRASSTMSRSSWAMASP